MRLIATLVVVPLLLAGCSKDLCKRTAGWAEDCGETVSDAEIEQCEEDLKDCSGSDEKKLNEVFDCLEKEGFFECENTETSPTTTTGSGFADLFALAACYAPAQDISPECAEGAGFSLGSTTGSTSSWTTDTGI